MRSDPEECDEENHMKAHRVETKLTQDGTLNLDNLPFHAGESVEVIVLETSPKTENPNLYPLRGKQPYRYDDPFDPPVPIEDWEVLK